jgi:hypothetical protein
MPRVSRRRFLGLAGALSLAGCSADGEDATPTVTRTETPTPTPTGTATPTATATPRASLDESLGFAAMLARTPTHPEMPEAAYVWARYVDAGGLLASVDDDTVGQRLRGGWLGSGPPKYTDSDAFELVHVQSGALPNVTLGRGAFDHETVVEGMVADGWTRRGGGEAFTRLGQGGYTAAVGDRLWVVTSTADAELVGGLTDAIDADPLVDHLAPVDRAAASRASEERGNYLVVQRSVPGDYAAGIALDYAPYRYPVGVLHYADGRESPSWQRVERRFQTQVAGELRAVDFGDDFG